MGIQYDINDIPGEDAYSDKVFSWQWGGAKPQQEANEKRRERDERLEDIAADREWDSQGDIC
jgi:hypothetical protein